MAHEDLRLLSSALGLGRFTHDELASAARTNPHTARSWVQRNRPLFTSVDTEATGGRGRPKTVWTLADGAEAEIRGRINQLDLSLLGRAPARPSLDFTKVEAQLEAWHVARKLHNNSAIEEAEHASLRRSIRFAWEEAADLFTLTQETPIVLEELAKMERAAGGGDLPGGNELRHYSLFAGRSLMRMNRRGGVDAFAFHVLRLRAQVRDPIEQVKLTAAVLAGPVWADEGLATDEVSGEVLTRCAAMADLTPAPQILDELTEAIGGGRAFCADPFDAQAVLRGLTSRPRLGSRPDVSAWISALSMKTFWRPALAPIAFHALIGAGGFHRKTLERTLGRGVEAALSNPPPKMGRLRSEPIIYCTDALKAAFTNRDRAPDEIVGFFNMRPDRGARLA